MPLTDDVVVRRKTPVRAAAKDRRRREILDAARDSFTESGYAGASLRDIAARVGITHAGLLHHYPEKVALLEAVLDDLFTEAADDLHLETDDPDEFFRGLVQLASLDATSLRSRRLTAILAAEATAPDHPAHGYFAGFYERVCRRLAHALAELDEVGRYRARGVPYDIAAIHLVALRDGVNTQLLLDPVRIDSVAVIRAQFELYVDVEF
jgi:AcrR family transcriptional regulator